MPEIISAAVNDPYISASTYARAWCQWWQATYDDRCVFGVAAGAEVQQSAQQGLEAIAFINCPQGTNLAGSPASAEGVTNNYTSNWVALAHTGTHEYTIYRTGVDQGVRIGGRISGKTVGGYGPMRMAGGANMYAIVNTDNSDGSPSIWVPKLALPSTPASASLSSAPVGGNAAGSCAASTGVGVTYDFYLDKNGSDVASKLGVSNSCTFTGYTVLGNTRYRVRALAKNASGSSGAVNSSWVYTAPAAPSGLSASSSSTAVNLSWSNTTFAATSTEIQRSTDGSNWVTIYSAGVVSSFTDTSAPSGTVYYRVRNIATGGTTSWSNTAQATTMQPPAAPDNISSIRNSDYQNTITWVNHSTVAAPYGGVRVKRSDNDGEYIEVASAVAESYVDTDTEPDHWYRYKISAYNGAGESSETVGAILKNSIAVPAALSVETTKELREPSMRVAFDPDTNYASYPSATKRAEFQLSASGKKYPVSGNNYPDGLVVNGKCEQTVGVWGTNLITNGDFSNGTTGWLNIGSTLSASGGVITCIGLGNAAQGGAAQAGISVLSGHKYYIAADMSMSKVSSANHLLQLRPLSSSEAVFSVRPNLANTYYRLSKIFTYASSGNFDVYFRAAYIDNTDQANSTTKIKCPMMIDLTAAFGAGNEPTAAQMDTYLAAYPNSWFNGSALLTTSGTPNSPSPTYPAPITTITGDLSITGANGDTVTASLGAVELCSLPDGTKDEYDAVTGVVTKRCGKVVFDGSADESIYLYTSRPVTGWGKFILDSSGGIRVSGIQRNGGMCNRLTWSAGYNYASDISTGNTIEFNSLFTQLIVVTTVALTVEDFKTWLAANPVTVIYKLATPYTIQLAPGLTDWSPVGESAASPFKFTVLDDEVEVNIRMRNKITISGTEYYSDWVTTEAYTNELIPLPPEFVEVYDGYVYVGVPLDVDSVSRDIEIFQSVNNGAWELYDTATVTSEDQTFAIPMDTIAQTLGIRARVSTQWGDSIFTDGETVTMGNRPTVDGDIMLAKVITESSSTDTIVHII